jgi:hypothetical protein
MFPLSIKGQYCQYKAKYPETSNWNYITHEHRGG